MVLHTWTNISISNWQFFNTLLSSKLSRGNVKHILFQQSGAGIIVENDEGMIVEISLGLSFPVTDNTAEYEAFLARLQIAKDLGANKIKIFTDSQLVASQVTADYQVREEHLQQYV